MSRRSKRRHRQANRRDHGVAAGRRVVPTRGAPGRAGRRGWWIGAVVVAAAAVLYAVSGGWGRNGDQVALGKTNAAVAIPVQGAATPDRARSAGVSAAQAAGPRIAFATSVYDFGQIKGGDVVKYSYAFTNVGGGTLEVTNVHASCGCTTAGEWTRRVEPGMTGSIPIQFTSGNFSGAVGKSITVTCNDTSQPSVVLQIKGTIWKPIDVTPQFAMLNMTSETASNATVVRIVNNEEAPLTLRAPESSNPAFGVELGTNQPGKEYQIMVRTVAPLPVGQVQGVVTVKTSSTNMPVINVTAWAIVQPAVTVAPAQIALPAIRVGTPPPATITIRNIGTNVLALSEPEANAKGVEMGVQEIQAGRLFTMTAKFPAGFEVAQGEKVELSVKTNHPQFPVIKVPVVQAPGPAPIFDRLGTPVAPTSAVQ